MRPGRITINGELLRDFELDPGRDYQKQSWGESVHYAPRHLSTMPRDITSCPRKDSYQKGTRTNCGFS